MEGNLARTDVTSHLDDETLSTLIDDPATADLVIRNHLASCAQCSARVEQLCSLRDVLQHVGRRELMPPTDLTPRILGKLRMRQAAIGSVNEIFAAVRALLQGFSSLIGGGPPSPSSGHSDREVPHG